MGEKKPTKRIFEYLDYREFLKDYYNAKKEANPAFSLRVFSDKIGFKAKDFISRVMNGDKNLSSQSIPKVASGLRLGKHETEFFVALVKFNQAETTDERNAAFEQMQAVLKVVRFAEKQHLLGHAQYMVYSDWRHLTIRSLIGMFGFDGDYEALAKMVHPHVTADEAKKSVKLLEDCELIKKGDDGKYVLTEIPATRLQRLVRKTDGSFERFCMGDSVLLLPDKKNAIVYRPADEDGNVIIQLQGQKLSVRHNRLKLLVPASQLYPPDYDFSIIFDTVTNRKAAHTMSRKFDPDAVIVIKEGKQNEE